MRPGDEKKKKTPGSAGGRTIADERLMGFSRFCVFSLEQP